jgi:AcrR family transcriptional regulator
MYGGRISYINRVRTMPRINPDYRREAREKIIAAALEIAAERGWDEVTLDAIARNVGTSKPALYNYFRSREELLRDVLFEVFRSFRGNLETALSPDEDLPANIRNLSRLLFEREHLRMNLFFQIPLSMMQDNESGEEFIRIIETSRNILCDCFSRARLRGELSLDVDPDDAAKTLIVLIFGLHVSAPFLRMDNEEKKRAWVRYVGRILRIADI